MALVCTKHSSTSTPDPGRRQGGDEIRRQNQSQTLLFYIIILAMFHRDHRTYKGIHMTTRKEIALDALRQSLHHWKQLRDDNPDKRIPTASQCACCATYRACDGCPIANYTKEICCKKTPYRLAYTAWLMDAPSFQSRASDEVDFIKEVIADLESQV